jgi:hypothetical protein
MSTSTTIIVVFDIASVLEQGSEWGFGQTGERAKKGQEPEHGLYAGV